MQVDIDKNSGFCFGVVNAIQKAEEELTQSGDIFCLGDIVHNSDEVKRLADKGLKVITHQELEQLHNCNVLLRAHGEPPSTYETAHRNGIRIIDATCPVVLKLQQRIKSSFSQSDSQRPQIVIYGKKGHAEVNGLVGQTSGQALVVEDVSEIEGIDFTRPVSLYSQTTKSISGFHKIIDAIGQRMAPGVKFEYFDTICRQVANRVDKMKEFACSHDLIIFVAGHKSSNGKVLYENCKSVNPNTIHIANASELKIAQITGFSKIGICGATSTPRWIMEDVKKKILSL